jgi:hypothetical protein
MLDSDARIFYNTIIFKGKLWVNKRLAGCLLAVGGHYVTHSHNIVSGSGNAVGFGRLKNRDVSRGAA